MLKLVSRSMEQEIVIVHIVAEYLAVLLTKSLIMSLRDGGMCAAQTR